MKPTQELFGTLQNAYDYFNQELFNNELPECLIVVHRKRNAHGYFWGEQFNNHDGKKLDEIALNPETMDRPNKILFSTLVHEMCHLWQHHFGNPSRRGYHNKEWANKMESVGLMPSTTGKPDGKKTGQRVTHYIIDKGNYEAAFGSWSLNQTGTWFTHRQEKETANKAVSKQKFTCPDCEQNAWAKPSANLVCGDCDVPMVAS